METIGVAGETFLPTDVCEVVGAPTLMRIAFEAVDATMWPRRLALENSGTPQPVLRTLVAFCYCRGIFASCEIERVARMDANVRYLCANDFPTWQEVQVFRRNNGAHLRETVARMLQADCDEIRAQASFFACLAEAEKRVRLAIEADSAAMDV